MTFFCFIFSVLNHFVFIGLWGVQRKHARVSPVSYPQCSSQDGLQILCNSLGSS